MQLTRRPGNTCTWANDRHTVDGCKVLNVAINVSSFLQAIGSFFPQIDMAGHEILLSHDREHFQGDSNFLMG